MQRVNQVSASHFKARLMTLRGHSDLCAVVVDGNKATINGVTVLKEVPNPSVKEMLVHEGAFRSIAVAWEHNNNTQSKRDAAVSSLARCVK